MSILKKVVLSILLLVITFPVIRPGFNLQIDPQIHWVFNYLFQNNFTETQHLIFPHGSLTFINFPLAMGDNLFWGSLIQALLRFGFIFTFLHLGNIIQPKRWWLHIVFAFVLLEFMELDFIISAMVANLLFLNHQTNKVSWLILVFVLATLGFYIKMSIGIISFSMIVPYLCLSRFETVVRLIDKSKNKAERIAVPQLQTVTRQGVFPLIGGLIFIPISLAIGWFLMYQNFDGFGKYFIGVLELVKGNSDSASLYPDNNWLMLSISFLSFSLIPFLPNRQTGLEKKKTTWLVYIVLGFSVFAVWKHGMARQDPWHIIKVFSWGMIFLSYIFILNKKIKPITIALSASALLFFYGNIQSSVGTFVDEFGWDGYRNFSNTFFHQKDLFEKDKKESLERIQVCKLIPKDLQLIDNQTVDCYPWNYAFVEMNQLNWQPRPVIQSYAAYTPWLDQQNTNHFLSEKAPQFLIWENDILNRDNWEGELTSIDNRYLLNDEPHTIVTIFSNYKIVSQQDAYLLLQKNKTALLENPISKATIKSKWEEWINVPYFGDGILRAKFQFDGTFLKWLKSKTYKDEPLFIEYQLENGEIRKYKFTTENATQGLWINPFIIQPSNNFINPITSKIRFSIGNIFFVKEGIEIEWQFFPIKNINERSGYKNAFTLFGKDILDEKKLALEKNDAIPNEIEIPKEGYSPSYNFPLSELNMDSTKNYFISAEVEAKISYHANASLVISIEKDGKSLLWQSKPLENFMSIYHQWELISFQRKIPYEKLDGAVLKVYVWNSGKENIDVKNLKFKIFENTSNVTAGFKLQ